jgi:hypothetical protein
MDRQLLRKDGGLCDSSAEISLCGGSPSVAFGRKSFEAPFICFYWHDGFHMGNLQNTVTSTRRINSILSCHHYLISLYYISCGLNSSAPAETTHASLPTVFSLEHTTRVILLFALQQPFLFITVEYLLSVWLIRISFVQISTTSRCDSLQQPSNIRCSSTVSLSGAVQSNISYRH